MKLQFKIQPYQTDAVESTVDIFNGQPNQGLLEYKIDQGKVYVIDNGKRIEQKGLGFSEFDTGYKNGEELEAVVFVRGRCAFGFGGLSEFGHLCRAQADAHRRH